MVGSISTGVAIAGGGWSKTSPVLGEFEAELVKQKQRKCDFKHVRVKLHYRGTQTSSDPRLAGRLTIKAESVVSTKNGWGRTEGKVEVRPSGEYHEGGFKGEFIGVVEPDGGVEGFVTGRTTGGRPVRLFANFNLDTNPDGSINGEFGQDSQEQKPYAPEEHQDPAIVTDACFKHGHGHGHGHGKGR